MPRAIIRLTEELFLQRLDLSSHTLRDVVVDHVAGTVELVLEDPYGVAVREGDRPLRRDITAEDYARAVAPGGGDLE